MLNPIVRKFQYGQHTVTLETGMMARQATAAVMVSMDDTAVFVTVVGQKKAKPGQDFFPLTVNYQERTYAAGRIPGSFFRREGRPSEGETLIARLIDRPIRPLFPEGFVNEVQVIATVVSVNPQVNPDIVAMIGASAALSLSGIPFNGPIGAARVGYINDQYVLNPTQDELKESKLDLVVAGTEAAVLMVESEAELLSEDQMLGAVVFGHEQQQVVIQNINELVKEAGKPRWDWQPEPVNEALNARVAALAEARLSDAYRITDKQERYAQVDVIKSETIATLLAEDETLDENELGEILHAIEKNVVRSRVLAGEPRIDGREKDIQKELKKLKNLKQTNIPKALAYVSGELFEQYIHDMKIVQHFAMLNRQAMMDEIVKGMKLHVEEQFTTIHNYIDTQNMILRKGAVSAQAGEQLLIPINMRDGSLLCVGKGNEDWNCSAPHGAGRLMSRADAKQSFTVSEFKKQMADIYTTSVSRATLDECPMAYKGMQDILDNIGPTAEVKKIIRPIYNFKAGDED